MVRINPQLPPNAYAQGGHANFSLCCASVKTTSYILKKYSKSPPSLIVHLHPTHFRFEQQDGSFPYNSEMKVIIEHIRAGTVPHDLIEELLRSGVRFYEGSLRIFCQSITKIIC